MESGSTEDLYKAIFEVTNANVITLKADPSVVLASKKYVDDKVALVSGELTTLRQQVTQHLADYEYQIPTINGTQIQLTKQSNSNRLLFKLESELSGNITVSTDGGATSKNLVDVDGVQVTSLDKGFHEVVATANFFIIRNKGGLSKTDLEALITIVNEAEANESVLRTEYINAVNAVDEKINLPSTATWNYILLKIPNLSKREVKIATLQIDDNTSTTYTVNSSGGVVTSAMRVTRGTNPLNKIPSYIFTIPIDRNYIFTFMSAFTKEPYKYYNLDAQFHVTNGISYSKTVNAYTNVFNVTEDGVILPSSGLTSTTTEVIGIFIE